MCHKIWERWGSICIFFKWCQLFFATKKGSMGYTVQQINVNWKLTPMYSHEDPRCSLYF